MCRSTMSGCGGRIEPSKDESTSIVDSFGGGMWDYIRWCTYILSYYLDPCITIISINGKVTHCLVPASMRLSNWKVRTRLSPPGIPSTPSGLQ
mmetsp:Transcript_12611/g.20377  ORF Transcript_12611/g.20377 Transcript_12611/m.20377 type:complete len:93 (+) Transcript_12611:1352-1630(+)